jgi:ribonuclease R
MPAPLPTRVEIVKSLQGESKALHAGVIAKRCGVEKASYRVFVELLGQLVVDGTLERDAGKRFRVSRPRRSNESWVGMLSAHPRGFGFVAASGKPDVYVPPEAMAGALHGDTVSIEVTGKNARGTEGRVAAVTARRNPRVAGLLRRKRKSAWLEPDDTRVRGPIILVDGFRDAEDGVAAVAEICRFPETPDENPEAIVVAVLGRPGEAQVEVTKIKIREQIEEEHPLAAISEAESLALGARRLTTTNRRDLRAVNLLTIDPKDARDHDDAVYAEKIKGGTRVYIAIADVSHYVTAGSELDAEAQKRGCTIYLPDRAIPMLPQLLAADLCSLLPDQERYCLCVIADLDADGRVKRFEVVEGLMRAAAMITYASAARTLGFTDEPPLSPAAEAFKKELKLLAGVTAKLRQARMKRGALNLDLPEPQIELNDEGRPTSVLRRAQDPGVKRTYQIVEELMLLANELVARWLGERESPAIYRVHGRPDEQKLERLGMVAEALGAPVDLEELQDPKGLARWMKQIAKLDKKSVLEGLLLRSLKQAVYDIVNIGHFGLASDAYLHFTSPIRRYPDLIVHRTIKQILRGDKPDRSPAATEQLRNAATTSSFRERAAMSVEREVVDLYRALYARDLLGEMLEGTVTALVGGGMYLNVDAPFIDVMIPFEGLGPDRYELSEDELSFVGTRSGDTISLGDKVLFEIEDVSILRRTVYGRRILYAQSDNESRPHREAQAKNAARRGASGKTQQEPRKKRGKTTGSAERPEVQAGAPRRKTAGPRRATTTTRTGADVSKEGVSGRTAPSKKGAAGASGPVRKSKRPARKT